MHSKSVVSYFIVLLNSWMAFFACFLWGVAVIKASEHHLSFYMELHKFSILSLKYWA